MKITKKNKKIFLEVITNESISKNSYRFFSREKLIYVVNGTLEIEFNGQRVIVSEKNILFVERGLYRYVVKTVNMLKLYEIDVVHSHLAQTAPKVEIDPVRKSIVEINKSNEQLRRTIDKFEVLTGLVSPAKFSTMINKIITRPNNLSEKVMWYKNLNPKFVMALDLIYENLSENFQVADIANKADISIFKLSRMFLKYFDMPLHKWLTNQRIMRAKMYLYETDLSVGLVSENVGFADTSNFISKYKKEYGITPLRERKIRDIKKM